MKINNIRIKNENVKKEVEDLFNWIRKYEPKDINNYQEIILNILRVVSDDSFIRDIQTLRQEFNMPIQCQKATTDEEYEFVFKWMDDNPKAPQYPLDERILNLCRKYSLNAIRYSEFIFGYFYGGGILPSRPIMYDRLSRDEARYRTRLEVESGYNKYPSVAYIKFFKDTTKNKLKKFIDNNWSDIQIIQKSLDNYPISNISQADVFKKNLEIYLLYFLGYKHADIRDEIKKIYNILIDEQNIRKIVSDMKKRINNSIDKHFILKEHLL